MFARGDRRDHRGSCRDRQEPSPRGKKLTQRKTRQGSFPPLYGKALAAMTDAHTEDHPEEALDRALLGTLTVAERSHLDRHLAICPACAAHLTLATSARARPNRDDKLAPWTVERVMARLHARPAPRWWSLSPRWAWALGGVLLLVATVVSAKLWRSRTTSSVPVVADQQRVATPTQRRAQAPQVPPLEAPDAPPSHRLPQPTAAESRPTAAELFNRA